MNTLARLQTWYLAQCNGEWEHSSGVNIQSCDNPGWWVTINLTGTALQTQQFAEIAEGVDDLRFALGSPWHGAGDETMLERILEVFLGWAEDNVGSLE